MDKLSDRKRHILRAIVIEYVESAEPVASDLIASKYGLGVRSATVRNEMAEITDMGYLAQPHTSAGRIPSDHGYRYYVDYLSEPKEAGPDSVKTLKRDEDVRSLVQEATRALSRMTRLMAAATTVRDGNVRAKHAVVTALGPEKALFVVVLDSGHTENRIVECPVGLTLEQIGQVNEALQSLVAGRTLLELTKCRPVPAGSPQIDALLSSVAARTRAMAKELTRGFFIVEGEEFMLSQPEFLREPTSLANLMDSLHDPESLRKELATQPGSQRGVTIGRENADEGHYHLSFMRQPFYLGSNEAGLFAVIGPTRMDYDRNTTMLDITAQSVTQILTKLFH